MTPPSPKAEKVKSQEEASQCSQFQAWTEVKFWQSDFLHSKVALHTSTLSEGAEQTKIKKKKSFYPENISMA